MPELQIMQVMGDNNTMTVLNYSMYYDVLYPDMYYQFDASLVIKDMTLFNEIIQQSREDFKQNKVKQIKIILDYGKDSAKTEYATLKINEKGFIEEYTPQTLSRNKEGLKFLYDDASRLTEITGVNSIDKKTFSFYNFFYHDSQLYEITKGLGSQFPEKYTLSYKEVNNEQLLFQIAAIQYQPRNENYYMNYTAEFNDKNKLSNFSGKFLLAEFRIKYSEENMKSSIEDTITCTNGYTTQFYFLKNKRITKKIFVREKGGTKSRSPREVYETINYQYDENNLLSGVESSVRDFPTFYLTFNYEYYQ